MAIRDYIRKNQKYLHLVVVIIICVYALYLRGETRASGKLWTDERVQIERMDRPLVEFLRYIPQHQYCGYLAGDYYLVYPFVRIFGPNNKWGLAIPHIIFTILGFWLLYLICRRYFNTVWGYLITFSVVCFNPTLLQHAFEIRRYAVLPTLALACLYLAFKLVDQNIKMSLKKKWLIGTFFVLTVWFDVYGVVILCLPLLFALLTKIKDPAFKLIIKDTIKFMAIVLAIAMPLWFFSIFGPHRPPDPWDPFQYIPNPLTNIIGFLKAVFANLIGYRHKQLYILLLGVILPMIIPYKKRFQQIAFLIIMVFIPVGVILSVDVMTKYWFIQRQFIWVMPFFAFFLGWVWDSVICYTTKFIRRNKQ